MSGDDDALSGADQMPTKGVGDPVMSCPAKAPLEIPSPPANLPGGPYTPAGPGQPPGTFYGPAQPDGPKSTLRYVPPYDPEAEQSGPPGSQGYWKVKQPGTSGWTRYDSDGVPRTPEEVHPGTPPATETPAPAADTAPVEAPTTATEMPVMDDILIIE